MSDLDLQVDASLDALNRSLDRVPEIGKSAAAKLTATFEREFKRSTGAHKESLRVAEKDTKETFEKIAVFGKELAGQLVPSLAPAADVVEGLGSNFGDLTEVLGPLGLGVAAAAVQIGIWTAAATGAVTAAEAISTAAVEARDRLEELNVKLDRGAAESLKAYEIATKSLNRELDTLTVRVGAPVAGEFAVFKKAVADNAAATWDAIVATNEFGLALEDNLLPGLGLARAGIRTGASSLYHAFTDTSRAALDAAAAVEVATAAAVKANRELDKGITTGPTWDGDTVTGQAKAADAAAKKAAEAQRKAAEAARKSNEAFQKLISTDAMEARAALKKMLDPAQIDTWAQGVVEWEGAWDQATAKLNVTGEAFEDVAILGENAITKLTKATEDWEAAQKKTEDQHKKRKEQALEWASVTQDAAKATLDVWSELLGQQLEREQETLAKRQRAYDRFKDKRKDLIERIRDAETEAEREQLEEQKAALDQKVANARNAEVMARNEALKTWRANQKLQLGQVAINAAATFGLTAANSPIPFPFNLAAAGVAAAAVGAQAIPIATANPPSFHTGDGRFGSRASDEMDVRVLRNEGAVTGRGIDALGGERGLRELNAGRSPADREIVINNTLRIDGRVAARSVERHRPGSSRVNIHSRRR